MKIHTDNLHQEDSLLTFKAEVPSILNILNKIIIERDMYDTYVSNFYEYHHVEFITCCFKRCQTAS